VLAPGTRLGSIQILEELGRGGVGVVYRARDDLLEREIAVKVLRRELAADPGFAERFEREARLAAKVTHPNVVKLHRADQVSGLSFLVTELIPGGSLHDRLRTTGRLPWPEAVKTCAAVARGLAAVHLAGLIHRDVKPGNVLLKGDVPKLGDFGLARRMTASISSVVLTRAGDVVGTPEYMAPEQADGSSVGSPADVYALGATLYALIAGHPPFEGQGFEVMKRHMLEAPRPLDEVVKGVPEAVSALVQRLLAKDPAMRGQAETVAEELESLAALADATPGRRRRGALVAALVIFVIFVIGGLGAALALAGRPASAPPAPPPPQPEPVDAAWTRAFVPDDRLGEAISVLGRATKESAPPEWAARRLVELREKDALVRGLRAARTAEERRALLASFLAKDPQHPEAAWARAQLEEATRDAAGTGWSGEELPRSVRRGPERPVLILTCRDGLELPLVYVPPGAFLLENQKKATIPRGFFLGRTEVTAGAYGTFCRATKHPVPLPADFVAVIEKPDDHPVVNVTWEDARDFCKWAGGRLPTELEWLRAARFTDGRNYPWGNEWDGTRANTCDASCPPDFEYGGERLGPRRDVTVDDHFPFTAPVGSFPTGASPEGALDLCGNVWEWCKDAFKGGHKIRGGSWEMNGKSCRSDWGPWYWTAFSISIGLRIAVDAP
jgi:hypothetical protein